MKPLIEYLPWIGLAVGLAGLLIRDKGEESDTGAPDLKLSFVGPVVAALLAVAGAQFLEGVLQTALRYFAGGAVAAALVAYAGNRLRTNTQGALLVGLGLAAFALGNEVSLLAIDSYIRLGGLVMGLGIGCLPSMAARRGRGAILLTLFVFSAGIVAMISKIGYRTEIADASVLALWCAILAVAVGWAVKKAAKDKAAWIVPVLAVVALVGLGWLSFDTYLGEGDLGICALAAVVAALVTAWAVKPELPTLLSWGVAALIWLGTATFTFSHAYGLGMAVAAVFGVATVFVIGRTDVLPPAWILVGLSLYRLFREHNGDLVQAFDIGQHYAMIGFLTGVVALVAVSDALVRHREEGGPVSARSFLVAAMGGLIVLGAAAFFGTKGAIGLMVGLAIAPMVGRLVPNATHWSVLASAALQCAVMVAYRPLSYEVTLDQTAKIRLLVWLAVGLAALWFAVWLIERKKNVKVVAQT